MELTTYQKAIRKYYLRGLFDEENLDLFERVGDITAEMKAQFIADKKAGLKR